MEERKNRRGKGRKGIPPLLLLGLDIEQLVGKLVRWQSSEKPPHSSCNF
jgi:hypothetical protein